MLRFLPFRALDLRQWDACVAASPGAPPSAQAWWLRATAGAWDAVVEPGLAGTYRALLPLPRRWRPGGWQVYQPHFTPYLGLLRTPASQQSDPAAWLAGAARHARGGFYQQGAPGLSLPDGPSGWQAGQRHTYQLDLRPSLAALRQGYAADYRRRLRRQAEAAPPLLEEPATDFEELLTLFLSYRDQTHTGLRPRHYAALRRLYHAANQRGLAELRQVRDPASGALWAGALFLRHAGGLLYLFAAASAAGRAAGAPLLLLDAAIGRHAGQPGRVLDFEGGNQPAVGRFFANFGACPVVYPTLTRPAQPWYHL